MFNSEHIVQGGGLLAVALIIFAECGFLIGIILPGDSLLLAAGVFAGKGKLPIEWLVVSVIIAAILGYQLGYRFGERIGPRLFRRKNGFLFREEYIGRTQQFFNKYGAATIVIARFVAHARTLVALIAGASNMKKGDYLLYNIVGAVLWGGGLTMLGYWLGSTVPNVDHYIIWGIIVTLVVLYAYTLWRLTNSPQRRHNLKKGLKEDWEYFFSKKQG